MAPLCVAAIALIVGGVAVYTIYSCLRKTPPPKPGDEEDDNTGQNFVTLMDLPGEAPVRARGRGGLLNITIEMSEDTIHWQSVGICKNTTLADFVFHHTNSLPRAFYRAAIY